MFRLTAFNCDNCDFCDREDICDECRRRNVPHRHPVLDEEEDTLVFTKIIVDEEEG